MKNSSEGTSGLRELLAAGDLEGCRMRLVQLAQSSTDTADFLALTRWRKRLRAAGPRSGHRKSIKVALLGGATTEFLEEPLALALDVLGCDATIRRSDYNTFAGEMLDPSSATASFAPDVAVVVATPANLPSWPEPDDDRDAVARCVAGVADYWLGLCAKLHEHTGCEIVLDNFHRSTTRALGNLGAKTAADPNNFILRVNLALGESAPEYVHINDVEALASAHGVRQWFDARYWYHAKQPVSFACLLPYVRSTARIVAALFGGTAKCLVLDLDNTLWGGVIGDDGPEGIRIGAGDPIGEAHQALQEYVLRLKQRGVILAVCSKNDEVQALRGFTERTGMLLRRDDFAAFRANWEPKPDNLVAIAKELNLGLSALVFMDDNPAEREHVRQLLPEVRVIELTDDPADYAQLLDDAAPFEITALSAEDRQRTEQYRANAERSRVLEGAQDYNSYLATLDQKAVMRSFDMEHLDRITQLINKTNQFNLTTERLSRSQVESLMHGDALTAYVRLTDRFGDNGLISVLAARREQTDYWIDLWLMSCRVLKRGVEQLLCNHLVEQVRQLGGERIFGVYRPTARNGMVAGHFEALGFEPAGTDADGSTRWCLEISRYSPSEVPIFIEQEVMA
jgi:FkbH-like protein